MIDDFRSSIAEKNGFYSSMVPLFFYGLVFLCILLSSLYCRSSICRSSVVALLLSPTSRLFVRL